MDLQVVSWDVEGSRVDDELWDDVAVWKSLRLEAYSDLETELLDIDLKRTFGHEEPLFIVHRCGSETCAEIIDFKGDVSILIWSHLNTFFIFSNMQAISFDGTISEIHIRKSLIIDDFQHLIHEGVFGGGQGLPVKGGGKTWVESIGEADAEN